jgi:hypothetical protein
MERERAAAAERAEREFRLAAVLIAAVTTVAVAIVMDKR